MVWLNIRAEIIKLTRQRAALFWGFLFLPVIKTFITLALVGAGPPALATAHAIEVIRPLRDAARALAIGGNPIAQLFYAVGAAAIFAVEYRHSGWRHLVPRANRWTLILSKFASFALFAGLSLVLVALGDVLVTTALPFVRGAAPVMADITLAGATTMLLSLVISLLELMALAGLVAFIAVATRSATGAIIAPFLLSLSATMAESYLAGSGGAMMPLPTFAGDALRQWVEIGAGSGDAARGAVVGLVVLMAWTGFGIGGTIALFSRQDLVSE